MGQAGGFMGKGFVALVLAGACAATAVASPREAQAQTMSGAACPNSCHNYATFSATTGGALLGAEVVMLTEGIVGVRNRWILLGSGAVGAIGGGIGGYF